MARKSLLALGWLGGVVLVRGMLGLYPIESEALLGQTGRTDGVILAITPHDHASLRYRYQVGREVFERLVASPFTPEHYLSLKVGDTLDVLYSIDHPSISSVSSDDPARRVRNIRLGRWFQAFLWGTFIAAAIAISTRRKPAVGRD